MNRENLHKQLESPENCARTLWDRVPGYIRRTFCAAVVFGLAAHLYTFTNKFTNHDDVISLFGNTYGAESGRWLCPILLQLGGGASMPWLVGVLSLLCLALAACLTVSLLRIRRPLACGITAALMVSFPVVLSTFTYMFTAFAYLSGLLLAVFGAWAAVRWNWKGSIAAAAAITLSLSVYQAYFPAAAALMVAALLLETLDGEKSFKALLLDGLRLLGTLAAALIVYMITVRITTSGELADYMGLQNMGRLSLPELPGQIARAYFNYFRFFLQDECGCHFEVLKYALPLAAVGSAGLFGLILWKKRLGWTRTALAVALALIFPLAADLIYVMVSGTPVHTLMLYALCLILVLPIALVEYAGPVLREGGMGIARSAVSWIVLVTMAVTAYSYIVTDNKSYLKLDMSIRQSEAYANRLVERIESCEGYEPGMSVVLVGSDVWDDSLVPVPEMKGVQFMGMLDPAILRASYTYGYFLRNFLGFPGTVYWGASPVAVDAGELDEVKEMPVYPRAGSVKVINDVAVVKMK